MRERDEELTIGLTRADLATRFGFTSQWQPATGRMSCMVTVDTADTVDESGAAGARGLRAEGVIQTVDRAGTVEMPDEEWRALLRGSLELELGDQHATEELPLIVDVPAPRELGIGAPR